MPLPGPQRPSGQSGQPGRQRRRPPPRPVEVVRVERLGPRVVSVLLGGEALRGFPEPSPTAHIKVFLPDRQGRFTPPVEGPEGLVWPQGRPTMRTYTPRRYDPVANTLEVQFVLHGDGPAARWAERAGPGDQAAVGGPGGRFTVDPNVAQWWIGGDESALPAIATLIEALPPAATARVHLEVGGPDDHIDLPRRSGVELTWHHRADAHAPRWGAELISAVRTAGLGPADHVWVACEAAAVRRIRGHLLTERSLPRDQVTTRGYWRLGEANHPDHDYGED